jgi:hypothetical protein
MSYAHRLTPWFLGIALALAAHAMQVVSDQSRATMPALKRFTLLPDGETLKVMSLGFKDVIADVIWLQAIQAIGERRVSDEAGQWIYRAMDIVTTLDTKFIEAYEAGGTALCTVVVMPDASNRLLEKGMKYNPGEWRLPFMLGINYYFELADDAKAAEYIAKAAAIGGGPPYLAPFATRLYMTAREPQKAIEFLVNSYEQTTDPHMKEYLELRLRHAVVERDIQLFETTIDQYRRQFGKPPATLESLVKDGLLREVPVDPFGDRYIYDSNTLKVRSASVERRFQAEGHRRQR